MQGEENLSLLLKQLDDETVSSLESKLHDKMAAEVAEVNKVDENKVISVLFGSESPGKNGKAVAEDLCQKIRKVPFPRQPGHRGSSRQPLESRRDAAGSSLRCRMQCPSPCRAPN